MHKLSDIHGKHKVDEKMFKTITKCLIEVLKKEFLDTFDAKLEQSFYIVLKIATKFMTKSKHKSGKLKHSSMKTPKHNNNNTNSNNNNKNDDTTDSTIVQSDPSMALRHISKQSSKTALLASSG